MIPFLHGRFISSVTFLLRVMNIEFVVDWIVNQVCFKSDNCPILIKMYYINLYSLLIRFLRISIKFFNCKMNSSSTANKSIHLLMIFCAKITSKTSSFKSPSEVVVPLSAHSQYVVIKRFELRTTCIILCFSF